MRDMVIITVPGRDGSLPHVFCDQLFARALRQANLAYPGRLATFHRWIRTKGEWTLVEHSLATV
jgi:hypothetical protein